MLFGNNFTIKPLYFMISFTIGILYVYLTNPKPQVVLKFPSPNNAGLLKYRDESNSCFVYDAKEVSCDTENAENIKDQPIQMI